VIKEDIAEYFKKCGMFKIDPVSGEDSIKLYLDKETGKPKGDARIGFAKPESVETAI